VTGVRLDPRRVRQYGERMWRRCGWIAVVAMAVCALSAARVGAGEAAPAVDPASARPTEAACTAACQALIDRCTGVFGPAMGDMRPFCTRAVIRRCRVTGVKACEVVAGERP